MSWSATHAIIFGTCVKLVLSKTKSVICTHLELDYLFKKKQYYANELYNHNTKYHNYQSNVNTHDHDNEITYTDVECDDTIIINPNPTNCSMCSNTNNDLYLTILTAINNINDSDLNHEQISQLLLEKETESEFQNVF